MAASDFPAGLPISAQCWITYRIQLFDLQCKLSDWFLYGIQHWTEIVQMNLQVIKGTPTLSIIWTQLFMHTLL